MPSIQRHLPTNQALKLSVLDRLMAPDEAALRSGTGSNLQRLRESVRRDLEDLLNTRVRCRSWPEGLDQLDHSLVNYGLPDFTGLKLGAPSEQETFRRILQTAIETFEPRLENVTVRRFQSGDPLDRTLTFRIEAVLRVTPVEEPIVLTSRIEPLSASFAVNRAER